MIEKFGEYDVVVVGGGASGCAAAISAARAGAKTLLIERFGMVGGMINVSGPPGWAFSHLWNYHGEQIIGGLVEEIHHRLEKDGKALPFPSIEDRNFRSFALIDPDWAGLLLVQMLEENNVDILLHSLAVDVVKRGNAVEGVIIENTNGRMVISGKVFVEATGEGDIAARAGVPFTKIDRIREEIDPPSVAFHMDNVDWDEVTKYYKAHPEEFLRFPSKPFKYRDPGQAEWNKKLLDALMTSESILDLVKRGIYGSANFYALSETAVKNKDIPSRGSDLGFYFTYRDGNFQAVFQHTAQAADCDVTDVRELTKAELECRKQIVMAIKAIKKYLPGFKNSYCSKILFCVRGREGRHFIGDYMLTSEDVAEARKFPDVIAKSAMHTSKGGPFHSCRYPAESINIDMVRVTPKDGGSYDIPYRCLVPKGVENLLLAGKLISTSEDFKRDLLPENIITGQAAGVAAALCSQYRITPRELEKDFSELQKILQQQGAILYTKY
ncbi:MAG: FAD-dependent oxidoreductase [Candidatus Bathyarchaeia archaeon]